MLGCIVHKLIYLEHWKSRRCFIIFNDFIYWFTCCFLLKQIYLNFHFCCWLCIPFLNDRAFVTRKPEEKVLNEFTRFAYLSIIVTTTELIEGKICVPQFKALPFFVYFEMTLYNLLKPLVSSLPPAQCFFLLLYNKHHCVLFKPLGMNLLPGML